VFGGVPFRLQEALPVIYENKRIDCEYRVDSSCCGKRFSARKKDKTVILSEAKDLLSKASERVEEILRFAQNDKSGGFFVAEDLQNPFTQQELGMHFTQNLAVLPEQHPVKGGLSSLCWRLYFDRVPKQAR
jgi:hypothetical protein